MNKSEKIAYEQLKSEGCLVEKPRRSKWMPQDFFYLFDFIAICGNKIRFIQATSQYLSQRPKEYQERFKTFPKLANTTKEWWRYNKKEKKFIIEEI